MEEQKTTPNTSYPFQKPLRTFEGDIADTLKNKNMSIAKIAIAEKEKKEENLLRDTPSGTSPAIKNILFLIGSLVLVAGGAYVLYVFYYLPGQKAPTPQGLVITSIVESDTQAEINLDANGNRPLMEVISELNTTATIPPNTIRQFYITKGAGNAKSIIDAGTFLSLLKVNAPDQFVRTLEPDFMFGIHNFDGNNPFIILKTSLYQSAFSGMLAWEKTLPDDLASLLANTDTPSSSPATSTSQILAIRKPFEDIVIKNKDVRALTNQYGRIILLYTFLDEQTILITTNEFTLNEILNRIENRRLVQ